MELSLFQKYQEFTPSENKVNKRSLIIQQFVDEINKERPCTFIKNGKKTKLGLINARIVAIKLSHIKSEFDLLFFLSECKDYRNRTGSFSKRFFGSIKSVEKLA